ncbi:IPT/TIG domain-containing protein [Mucilaginibacter calamicampi]|uniref:IPT/TIG domain-containing protein n=1 Tax=Mucilaginibacter calamicampi TaxID=1302352 RepID=A0ABW2Z1C5_9SPHI
MRKLVLITMCMLCMLGCKKSEKPQPAQPPMISSFSPMDAQVGETIKISGTNFGTDINAVFVNIGSSANAKPNSVTDTEIWINIPPDAKSGYIQVTSKGNAATSSQQFTLTDATTPRHTISAFSPTSAKVGENVTITGTGFGTSKDLVSIKFGASVDVHPQTISATQITVVVPADAASGNIKVAVNGSSYLSSTGTFTLKVPQVVIAEFYPTTATLGDTVILKGTFGTDLANHRIYFNGADMVHPFKYTDKELQVVVPSKATTGKIKVYSNYYLETAESKTDIIILPITGVYQIKQTSARLGETVLINGDFDNVDKAKITVLFFGSATPVHPYRVSGSYIYVKIPDDARTGKIKVTRDGYGTGTSASSFMIATPLPAVPSGTWTVRPEMPIIPGRQGAIAFVIGKKAYIGMGTTNAPFDDHAESDMWEYDQKYDAWTQVASYAGGGRVFATAFAIGSKGYVGTGEDNAVAVTKDFWEYDSSLNTWTRKADLPATARAHATAFTVDNKGYIATGLNGNTMMSDVYQYTPAINSWLKVASIPTTRYAPYSFVISDKAYVGGGNINDLYMYDYSNNTWTAKAAITGYDYLIGNSSFAVGGKAYIGLGFKGSTTTKKVFCYNPASNSWQQIADFGGDARTFGVGFALGDIGYFGLGGGSSNYGVVYKDLWAYKP